MNVYDLLYPTLTGRPPGQGSDLWHSSSHFAHVLGLRNLVASGGKPTAVLLGSSLVARGVDPVIVDDMTDDDVVSFGLFAATQPVHVALGDQAMDIAPTIDTVVWGQSSHPFMRPCTTDDAESIAEIRALQEGAFGGIPELDKLPHTDRLFGPAGSGAYAKSPIRTSSRLVHGDWEDRGASPPLEGVDAKRKATQSKPFTSVYADPVVCEELLQFVAETIERWTANGVEVILYVPALSDEMTDFHPDGRAGHDAVIARLRELAEVEGAAFADFSDLVDDSGFHDLTHVNASGRTKLTAAVGDWVAQAS